jgi:hypothetical protein
MAHFIKEAQFDGMFNLVIEDGSFFQDFATQWEDIWVEKLFGYDLWNTYQTDPGDPNMVDFKEECERILKYFFYRDYSLEVQSFQSTIGNMGADTENANRGKQSRNYKMVKLWNIGVDMYPESHSYLKDLDKYPGLSSEPAEIERENVFGI